MRSPAKRSFIHISFVPVVNLLAILLGAVALSSTDRSSRVGVGRRAVGNSWMNANESSIVRATDLRAMAPSTKWKLRQQLQLLRCSSCSRRLLFELRKF